MLVVFCSFGDGVLDFSVATGVVGVISVLHTLLCVLTVASPSFLTLVLLVYFTPDNWFQRPPIDAAFILFLILLSCFSCLSGCITEGFFLTLKTDGHFVFTALKQFAQTVP